MLIKKEFVTKDDLCVFFNENMAKIIQNIGARNGKLSSFELNFNFEKSNYCLTDRDIRSFRSRTTKEE